MAEQMLAGVEQITITPPVGVDLCGFGGRSGSSQGVLDDLRGAALYLCDGASRVLVLTADLIGLHRDEVAEIRTGILARTGVPPAGVMICCSHTHAGPATHCIDYLGMHDEPYLASLKQRLIEAAGAAVKAARPARVGWASVPVSVAINRREARNGRIVIGTNQRGVTEPHADALYVDDATGRPMARLVCHAAHAVTLGGDNLQISADWPGHAQRQIEARQPGVVAMFMQGCCGNLNSHPRGSVEIAEQQGRAVADAVCQGDAAATRRRDAVVAAASRVLLLPLQDPPPVATAEKRVADLRADTERTAAGDNYGVRMMKRGMVTWAEKVLALAKAGATGLTVPFEVQALRVGDMALVGLPGEVFVEYALNLTAISRLGVTAVAGYTNGNIGYVPTAQAFAEGGYEVETAIRFYGLTMLRPECEKVILDGGAEVLRTVA